MKYIIALFFIFSTFVLSNNVYAQDQPQEQQGGGTQEDLDKINEKATKQQMSPEQKAYLKKIEKAKKEKDKKDAITRKRAQKVHDQRLNKAKSKVAGKKKQYVKSHNKKKK